MIVIIIIAIICAGLIVIYLTNKKTEKTFTFTPYDWAAFKTCPANPSDSDLDPQIQEMLKETTPAAKKEEVNRIQEGADDPEGKKLDPLRQQFEDRMKDIKLDPVESVQDKNIPGPHGDIPIRIYSPGSSDKLPVILFIHGGGWSLGSLNSYNNVTHALASRIPAIVISVDYRLAPEYPFPIPFNESYQSLEWVSDNIEDLNGDPEKIAVAGDSAGGNLAAAVAIKARNENGPKIFHQILYYPGTNLASTNDFSYSRFSDGYDLTKGMVEACINCYVPDPETRSDPYVSPLLADDLSGLPPALIIAAQFDPLLDQGLAYAGKLNLANVPVQYSCYTGVIHGFVSMLPDNKSADQAIEETAKIFQ